MKKVTSKKVDFFCLSKKVDFSENPKKQTFRNFSKFGVQKSRLFRVFFFLTNKNFSMDCNKSRKSTFLDISKKSTFLDIQKKSTFLDSKSLLFWILPKIKSLLFWTPKSLLFWTVLECGIQKVYFFGCNPIDSGQPHGQSLKLTLRLNLRIFKGTLRLEIYTTNVNSKK